MRRILFVLCLTLLFSACGSAPDLDRIELNGLQEAELQSQIMESVFTKQTDAVHSFFYCPGDRDIAELCTAIEHSEIQILEDNLCVDEKVALTERLYFYPLELKYRLPEQETVFCRKAAIYVRLAKRYDESGEKTHTSDAYVFLRWEHIPEEIKEGAARPAADTGTTLMDILNGA